MLSYWAGRRKNRDFLLGFYSTIKSEEDDGWGPVSYRLDYPNLEVRQSLNSVLPEHLTGGISD